MLWSRSAEGAGSYARAAVWQLLLATLAIGQAASPTAWSSPSNTPPGFKIRHAAARLVEGVYLLDARIDYDFSPESIEAMDSGVPLTILLEIDIARDRSIVDEHVARLRSRQRIEKHSLSEQYVVTDLSTRRSRTYRSFEEMSAGLGNIESLPILDRRLLSHGKRYTLRLRARLDIEALPSPLRPLAYLTAPWRLSSDWYSWSLSP